MGDPGGWADVEIPGASLLARCLGRDRLLMDPGSAAAMRALAQALRHVRTADWNLLPSTALRRILKLLLDAGVEISDILDARDPHRLP
jgi:hypothetical protein